MAKKIHAVVLKEVEIIEIDGEFREVFRNEKKYPLYITNHALRRGRDLGLVESSLIADLLRLEKNTNGKKKEEAARSLLDDLSEEKMINLIYIAFIGANPKSEMSLDDFIEHYHGTYIETVTLYTEIISSTITNGDNNFAAGLRKSTSKPKSGTKK